MCGFDAWACCWIRVEYSRSAASSSESLSDSSSISMSTSLLRTRRLWPRALQQELKTLLMLGPCVSFGHSSTKPSLSPEPRTEGP